MTTAREKWLSESRKRLRELWGLTKDQTDIAIAMMQDAMAVADQTRQEPTQHVPIPSLEGKPLWPAPPPAREGGAGEEKP